MLKQIRSLARRLISSGPSLEETQERLYADERACAMSILSAEAVQATYLRLAVDPEIIQGRLSNLRDPEENTDADQVLNAGSLWHAHMSSLANTVHMDLCRLVGLLVHGSPEIKEALTPPGGVPGDIPFLVAHKQIETQLQSGWPEPNEQTGNVLLVNDPFTPMEVVVNALETSFGIGREQAIKKMLEVHHSGASTLEIKSIANATDACISFNTEWRSRGLPLYCVPERLPVSRPVAQ